ncbi:MAG: choice-of-anchor M domain-containing protein [Verrucomicrobiota bacterium]
MTKPNSSLIGRIRQLGLAALLTTGLTSQAQSILYDGHTDVGIDYDSALNAWNLHVHHEVTDTEYSPPSDAVLFVKNSALGTVPAGAPWSFLGAAGSDLWILPKVQDPNLLFLGFGAEEIAAGTFLNDQFTMSLKGVTGPGNFAVFDTDSFDNPVVWMNSADGINGSDSRVLPSGDHSHVNWGFTAPGDYTVLFEASAFRASDSQFTTSGDVAYTFRVEAVPEPSPIAFASLIGVALAAWRQRK